MYFRFGRRVLLIFSCLFSAITVGILGGYFLAMNLGEKADGVIPLIAVTCLAIANRLGLGTIPSVISGKKLHFIFNQ